MLLFKSTATRTSLVGQAAYRSLADKRVKSIDKKCSRCSSWIFFFFACVQNTKYVKILKIHFFMARAMFLLRDNPLTVIQYKDIWDGPLVKARVGNVF